LGERLALLDHATGEVPEAGVLAELEEDLAILGDSDGSAE
jgi:hypothetical protein